MRILIAGREEASLEIMQSFLWDRGYEVEIAGNGLECAAIMRDFLPDILVLERELLWGGSDGVMAHMRMDPALAGTPVILISNDDPIMDREIQSLPPLVGWLRKPFRLSDLTKQLTYASQNVGLLNLEMGAI